MQVKAIHVRYSLIVCGRSRQSATVVRLALTTLVNVAPQAAGHYGKLHNMLRVQSDE